MSEQEIEVYEAPEASPSLFTSSDPIETLERATRVANVLTGVVRQRDLAKHLNKKDPKKEYLVFEAWNLLGAFADLHARTEWTRPIGEAGWEARVEIVNGAGQVIGTAEAQCMRAERSGNWRSADDYAIRSMAQTRAAAKGFRMQLSFVAVLAGFEATPAEEMVVEDGQPERREQPGGAIVPHSWTEIKKQITLYDPTTQLAFNEFGAQAKEHVKGASALLQKTATVITALVESHPPNEFPPPRRQEFQGHWAAVLDGVMLPGPEWRMSPDESERPPLEGDEQPGD